MRSVRFSRLARSQLQAVARYLLEQTGDERAGEKFVRSIEARMLKLAKLSASIFGYGADTIDVVQVLHSRQDIDAHFFEGDL